MIIWIIIGVVVAVLISGLFHAEHMMNKLKIFFFVLIALLVLFSIIGFFTSKNADLTSPKGVIGSIYGYFGWIADKGTQIFSISKGTINTIGNIILSNVTMDNSNIKDGRK